MKSAMSMMTAALLILACLMSGCGRVSNNEEVAVLSDAEQQTMIDEDEDKAEEALFEYLHAKYGFAKGDYRIDVNEPEVSRWVYSDGHALPVRKPQYTGYFLAEVVVDGKTVHVKYSPCGEKDVFALGGADDYQTGGLEGDIRRLTLGELPIQPDRLEVFSGATIPVSEERWCDVYILGGLYDGKDYSTPILATPRGGIRIKLYYETARPNVDEVESGLARLFDSAEFQVSASIFWHETGKPLKSKLWFNANGRSAADSLQRALRQGYGI